MTDPNRNPGIYPGTTGRDRLPERAPIVDREYIVPIRVVLGSVEPLTRAQRLALIREIAATTMVHCDIKTPASNAADTPAQMVTGSAFVVPGGSTWSGIKRELERERNSERKIFKEGRL